MYTHKHMHTCKCIEGGEDPLDALSCRSFFAKEPLIIWLFCGKWPMKIRHPVGLRHSVSADAYLSADTATHRNTLQHTATHRNTLQHTAYLSAMYTCVYLLCTRVYIQPIRWNTAAIYVWMSHVIHMKESWNVHKWVMLYMCMLLVTCMNEW